MGQSCYETINAAKIFCEECVTKPPPLFGKRIRGALIVVCQRVSARGLHSHPNDLGWAGLGVMAVGEAAGVGVRDSVRFRISPRDEEREYFGAFS
jgi:hypothetical protein